MATEKRLISVNDCPCDGCKAKPCGHPAHCVKFALWLNKTVDAVEVVRCKDCKHRDEYGCCTPPIISSYGWDHLEPKDNDYCSYGERKDNVL